MKDEDFKSIAVNLIDCFKKFNDLEKIVQKEFSTGWLRKMTLNKIVGKTAREKLEAEQIISQNSHLRSSFQSSNTNELLDLDKTEESDKTKFD